MKKIISWRALLAFATVTMLFQGSFGAQAVTDGATLGPNLIQNPSFESAGIAGPTGWSRGRWGTNQATFSYPVAGRSGNAAQVQLTSWSSGDAKWYFNTVPVQAGETYTFSDYYKSTAQSWVTVRYTNSNGSFSYVDLGFVQPSANWLQFTKTFTVPQGVTGLTIFHLINRVGTLVVDDYFFGLTTASDPKMFSEGMISLTFDDGWKTTYQNATPILNAAGLKATYYIITGRFSFPAYMTASETLAVENAGHEIGSHTKTHRDLTALSTSEMQSEIVGSRTDLLNIGVKTVNSFAYPFGAYNSQTDQLVRSTYTGARTSDGGETQKNENRYLLERRPVNVDTSVAQVKAWIDAAINQKTWQILVLHRIDHSGTQYSTTPENLKQIVDYLKLKNMRVVTLREGVQIMQQ